jgi:hypothetical protein
MYDLSEEVAERTQKELAAARYAKIKKGYLAQYERKVSYGFGRSGREISGDA